MKITIITAAALVFFSLAPVVHAQRLNSEQATAAFNELQDRYNRPHARSVVYDQQTDSYHWIGPKFGKPMVMSGAQFEGEVSAPYKLAHQVPVGQDSPATKTVKRATLVSPASTATPETKANATTTLTLAPDAPDLSYIRPLKHGVTLGWQDSQPHKGSYRVAYGKFGESHHAHLIDVNSPPIEIGDLEAGTTYYFSVYFIDGVTHRSSDYSNEQSVVVSATGPEITATPTPSPFKTATPSFTPYTRSTSSSAGGAAAGGVVVGGFFLWIIFSIVCYFLPTIIAAARHHHNTGPIFVVNFFLGWTLIGWVCSLAWSFTTATVAPVNFYPAS